MDNLLKGFCNKNATTNFFNERNIKNSSLETIENGIKISTVGIGTYKGESNAKGDQNWEDSIIKAVQEGFNVIDTAAKYRNFRSEKVIGRCIKKLQEDYAISRDCIFISTKGGLIGIPDNIDSKKDYLNSYLSEKLSIKNDDIYKNEFCMHPDFIADQIDQSRKRLNLEIIDCYYLHNPEILFLYKSNDEVYKIIYSVFEILEDAIKKKKINAYGIASWNGLRRRRENPFFLDFKKLVKFAKQINSKNNGFRYAQIPISIGMPFILKYGYLEELSKNGFNIFTSASAYEGKLEELENLTKLFKIVGFEDSKFEENPLPISFPTSSNSFIQLIELLNDFKNKNIILSQLLKNLSPSLEIYPAAINLVRSLPEVKSALVGMEEKKYVEMNSKLIKSSMLSKNKLDIFKNLFL